jgi:hypothetical protein
VPTPEPNTQDWVFSVIGNACFPAIVGRVMKQPLATKTMHHMRQKRVPHVDGGLRGWQWVPEFEELADVELSVDVDRLMALLGPRALRSKKGISSFVGGAIVAKATNRRPP